MSDATPIADADPLCRMGAQELRQAYASRRLSPVEVARAALDRAEAIQPRFNAFTRIAHEAALAQAQASEERWARGAPLSDVDGVPATIKDIVWVADWPIRYGSLSTGETPSPHDAPGSGADAGRRSRLPRPDHDARVWLEGAGPMAR